MAYVRVVSFIIGPDHQSFALRNLVVGSRSGVNSSNVSMAQMIYACVDHLSSIYACVGACLLDRGVD